MSNLADFDTAGPGSFFTASNVPAGTYYVRVRSLNGCGESGVSNEVLLTVMNFTGPVRTGQWLGVAPDGIVAPTAACEGEFDLQLDLTQTGSALAGTGMLRVRASTGGSGCARVGDIISSPLTGTVGADGSIAIRIPIPGQGFADFSGTSTAARMSGGITFSVNGPPYNGTWAVNRQ